MNKEDKIAIDIIQIIEKSDYIQKRYISRAKIEEVIKEWDESIKWNNADDHYYAIKILKKILEGK